MKIPSPQNLFYQVLFVLCIAIPYLNNFELTFATWTIALLVSVTRSYSVSIIKIVIPFILILIIATVVMMFRDHNTYLIIRDVTYLIKPVFGFLIGYQLCKRNMKSAFELLIKTAFIIAVIHIIILIFAVLYHKAYTLNDIRFYGGYFSDFEIYAVILLVFHKQFELQFSKKWIRIFTIVIGISAFMYFARTNFIQFLVLYLAVKGYFKITKKSIILITSIVITAIVGYSVILYINPKRNGDGIEAFLYKLKVAPTEPFKTRIDREDYVDFNDNFRSWENLMTTRQVTREGWTSTIFGKGLGSQVDLKQEVYLGDMQLRFISILHNGFMIVFLKSGLLGIIIYLYTIIFFFIKQPGSSEKTKHINRLFLGTGVFLLMSNWVFLGFYNLIETKSILMGFLIAYCQATKNKK